MMRNSDLHKEIKTQEMLNMCANIFLVSWKELCSAKYMMFVSYVEIHNNSTKNGKGEEIHWCKAIICL